MKYSAPGILHKSGLYTQVAKELGQIVQKVYGFGLKIAILYFLSLSASMVKNFKGCRLAR
jgi:hypothetical protein